jgi:hypothetical protein
MGRLTQAMAFTNISPSDLTELWKKDILTKLELNAGVLKLRSERLKQIRKEEKQGDVQTNLF